MNSTKTTKSKKKKSVIVAVSGYFNPLHVGHLEMIERAKKLGDKLVVIINNDHQVKLKGSVPFMKQEDRIKIIKALRDVDEVFLSIDKDKTVCKSLSKVKPNIFANGGDRKSIGDVPEYPICQKLGITMVDGLGRKIRASSELIKKAAEAKIIAVKK
jgi:cytidyltransferase-like protein